MKRTFEVKTHGTERGERFVVVGGGFWVEQMHREDAQRIADALELSLERTMESAPRDRTRILVRQKNITDKDIWAIGVWDTASLTTLGAWRTSLNLLPDNFATAWRFLQLPEDW